MSLETLLIQIEAIDAASRPIQKIAQEIENLEKLGGNLGKIGDQMTSMGATMTRNVTAPIVAGLAESARVAAEFESAMFDVNKAFGFEAGSQQAEMAESAVKSLSLELGQLPPDVAAIATEAGKLGVQFDQFEDYTRFVTATGVAFDMTAQQAGESIGTLTNVLGYMDANNRVNIAGLEQLGDTINYLADSGATSESAIVSVLQRSGGIAKSFGLANEESAALAAAFLNLGYPPEVVGTAINGMLPALQNATQQTSQFQDALAQIGLPAAEFEKLIAKDAAGAIDTLLTAIDASGDSSIISRMFGSGSDSSMLTTAVANLDRFRATMQSLDNVEAGSMMETFARRAETSEAQMQKLRASTYLLRNEIGAALLPAINDIVQALIPVVSGFADFAEKNPEIVRMAATFALIAAAIGPALIAIGQVVTAVGKISKAFSVAKLAMMKFAGPISSVLGGVGKMFMTLLKGPGLLAGILLGVVFAVFKIGAAFMGQTFTIREFFDVIKMSLMELPANLAQIPEAIGAIFSALKMIVLNQIAGIKLAFAQVVMAITTTFAGVREQVSMIFTAIVTSISTRIASIIERFQAVSAGVRAAFEQARAAAVTGIAGIIAAITSGISRTVAAVGNMGSQIISRITSIAGQAREAGRRIVTSIADGIRSGISAVMDAASAVANAVKNALPGSPVKEGPLRVLNNISGNPGAKIAEMLAAGISAGSPAVAAAMDRLAGVGGAAMETIPSTPRTAIAPMPRPAASTASAGGGVINLDARLTINGVTSPDSPDFLQALQQHREQIIQIVRDMSANDSRVAYQ